MKKLLFFPAIGLAVLYLWGCGNTVNSPPPQSLQPVISQANAVVAKDAEVQGSILFTLSSTHAANSVWKVYNAASGGTALDTIIVDYHPPHTLILNSMQGNIVAGNYWITITEDGRSESERTGITVLPFQSEDQSDPPTADFVNTTVTKITPLQTIIQFTLNSSHPGSAVWKVYDSAEAADPLTTVNALFSPAQRILTFMAATGLNDIPHGTYHVSVTESEKTESTRLALTIIPYVLDVSDTPTVNAANASVAKTSQPQASITFTLSSSHTGTWSVYNPGGTLLTAITASFTVATRALVLTAAGGGDIGAGTYHVRVTESGKSESESLALTVLPYVPPATDPPTIDPINAAIAKSSPTQQSVFFTLTSSHTGTWRVYEHALGGSQLTTVNAAFNTTTRILTLSASGSDIPSATYHVSVTEADKAESIRLALTVGAYIPAAIGEALRLRYEVNASRTAFTAHPAAGISWNAGLESGASIITLNGYPMVDVGASNGWVDLGAGLGTVLTALPAFTVETYVYVPDTVSITGAGNFIWSFSNSATGSATAGRYMWLRATQQRFAISSGGWNNEQFSTPAAAMGRGEWRHVVLTKDTSDNFRVFVDGELMGSGTSTITVSSLGALDFNYLARPLFSNDSFLRDARYYRLSIYNEAFTQQQIQNDLGAEMLLAVLPVESRPPVISSANAFVAKVDFTQSQVTFRFDSVIDGIWRIYTTPSGGTPLTNINTSLYGNILTLAVPPGGYIPAATYFISVLEPGRGRIESSRVALTVGPYVPPPKQITVIFGGIPDDPVTVTGSGQTVSKNGGSLEISVANPQLFDSFVWRLNGAVQTGQTGGTFTLSGSSLQALGNGEHRVMVIAIRNGIPWSGEVAFTVTD